jgi:hypothetical protein
MKQFIVAIFLCVACSALANAAQRKIAYERDGNRMSLDSKNPKLLVKHARTPSTNVP